MAQCLIRPGSGPKRRSTLPMSLPATCSVECLKGRRVPVRGRHAQSMPAIAAAWYAPVASLRPPEVDAELVPSLTRTLSTSFSPSLSTPARERRAPPWPSRQLLCHYRSPSVERPCRSHSPPPQSLHDLLSVPRLRASVADRAMATVAGCRSPPTAVHGQATAGRRRPCKSPEPVRAGPHVLRRHCRVASLLPLPVVRERRHGWGGPSSPLPWTSHLGPPLGHP